MMSAMPIVGRPILSLRDEGILVVGDLHIGVESGLGARGIHVPSQTFMMEEEIAQTADGHQRLVVIGDVKHQVPGSTPQEHKEVPRFFELALNLFEQVDVVRGNHDAGLEPFLPEGVIVHPASGLKIGELGLIHGHTWPSTEVMASKLMVMAHNHPVLQFRDGVGHRSNEPCWVRFHKTHDQGRYLQIPEETILIPALNRALGGSPVNLEGRKLLGPLFRKGLLDPSDGIAYLLDGMKVGKVGDLMVPAKERRSKSGRKRLR